MVYKFEGEGWCILCNIYVKTMSHFVTSSVVAFEDFLQSILLLSLSLVSIPYFSVVIYSIFKCLYLL